MSSWTAVGSAVVMTAIYAGAHRVPTIPLDAASIPGTGQLVLSVTGSALILRGGDKGTVTMGILMACFAPLISGADAGRVSDTFWYLIQSLPQLAVGSLAGFGVRLYESRATVKAAAVR